MIKCNDIESTEVVELPAIFQYIPQPELVILFVKPQEGVVLRTSDKSKLGKYEQTLLNCYKKDKWKLYREKVTISN